MSSKLDTLILKLSKVEMNAPTTSPNRIEIESLKNKKVDIQ